MTDRSIEADSIRRDRCGGVFPVRVFAPTVPCPYCRNRQSVPEPQMKALEAYVATAKGRMERAHSYASSASTLPGYRGRRAHHPWVEPFKARYAVALGIGIGLALTAFIFVLYATQLPWSEILAVEQEIIVYTLISCVLGATVLTLAIWFGYGYIGSIGRASVPMTAAACPNCGATTSMQVGTPLAVCDHCGATLLPSPELRESALQAAATEEQQALDELNRLRVLAGDNDPYKKTTVEDIERLLND